MAGAGGRWRSGGAPAGRPNSVAPHIASGPTRRAAAPTPYGFRMGSSSSPRTICSGCTIASTSSSRLSTTSGSTWRAVPRPALVARPWSTWWPRQTTWWAWSSSLSGNESFLLARPPIMYIMSSHEGCRGRSGHLCSWWVPRPLPIDLPATDRAVRVRRSLLEPEFLGSNVVGREGSEPSSEAEAAKTVLPKDGAQGYRRAVRMGPRSCGLPWSTRCREFREPRPLNEVDRAEERRMRLKPAEEWRPVIGVPDDLARWAPRRRLQGPGGLR